MAYDLEHVMCAFDGGLKREKFPEAISAYSPSCFWSILGDCPSHGGVWFGGERGRRILKEVIYKSSFLEINVLSLVKNDFNFAFKTWIKHC